MINFGVDNIARKMSKGWIGVDNTCREIKAIWIGVDNVARLAWQSFKAKFTQGVSLIVNNTVIIKNTKFYTNTKIENVTKFNDNKYMLSARRYCSDGSYDYFTYFAYINDSGGIVNLQEFLPYRSYPINAKINDEWVARYNSSNYSIECVRISDQYTIKYALYNSDYSVTQLVPLGNNKFIATQIHPVHGSSSDYWTFYYPNNLLIMQLDVNNLTLTQLANKYIGSGTSGMPIDVLGDNSFYFYNRVYASSSLSDRIIIQHFTIDSNNNVNLGASLDLTNNIITENYQLTEFITLDNNHIMCLHNGLNKLAFVLKFNGNSFNIQSNTLALPNDDQDKLFCKVGESSTVFSVDQYAYNYNPTLIHFDGNNTLEYTSISFPNYEKYDFTLLTRYPLPFKEGQIIDFYSNDSYDTNFITKVYTFK